MQRLSGPGRSPRLEMRAEDVVGLMNSIEAAGIDVWLDGGWAVDAALETQTRPHDDLDLVIELQNVARLQKVLERRSYVLVGGGAPKSFEMTDSNGRQVDVHPIASSDSGDGVYLMNSGEEWVYPAAGFTGTGRVLHKKVRCLTPEVQILCHAGYTPHRTSYDDVWSLSRRFGIPAPTEYGRSRESYPLREAEH